MLLEEIKRFVVQKLEKELSPRLYYHDIRHTLDVFEVTNEIALLEQVSPADRLLLGIAALFHDIGFVRSRSDHELVSCEMAREFLPQFGLEPEAVNQICGMVMATKIPQNPQNFVESILCDADLDYLGRPDFHQIANLLFMELKAYDILHDEQAWNRLQVIFMKSHQYFTKTNQERRGSSKAKHLEEVISRLSPHFHE
jgi:uncharacterized protein